MKWLTSVALCIAALFYHNAVASDKNAHDFSFTAIDGSPLPLSQFKGKVLLVVNTASECGFTGQYQGLQKLYDAYKNKGLVVLGVPSNDFGGQEPGSANEIKKFCETKFRVTFPLTEKAVVKGENAHPFYQWVSGLKGVIAPKWNFHKFLIAKDGSYVDYYISATEPDSDKIRKAVEKELAK